MKKILLLLAFATTAVTNAQHITDAPWFPKAEENARKQNRPVTMQEVQQAFNDYWKDKNEDAKGSGYKPFKRWENRWSYYVRPDGTLPTAKELWDTYVDFKAMADEAELANQDNSKWEPLGPFSHTRKGSWSPGQGRINVVKQDPKDKNTIYAGAPAGGFWKSKDGGKTWKTTTDGLPQIGVSAIAVDYNNTDIIYIATGDDDAGDSLSMGVFKSTDGGETWEQTGLNPSNAPIVMSDLYIDPKDSNKLWAATTNGVYRSVDAGKSWTSTMNGQNVKDIKIKPGDTNTIYAATQSTVYKSTNSGESFTKSNSGLPSGVERIVLDVTPANPEVVYALCTTRTRLKGLYKSSNSAGSFKSITTSGLIDSQQSWYDLGLGVSNKDENIVFTGELNVWKGTNGSFKKINDWAQPTGRAYTHADIHFIRYYDGVLYVGSDGGVFRSTNDGSSFTDITKGIQNGQFYRISVAKGNVSKIVGGLQDNGGYGNSGRNWNNWYGADGMDVAVDPTNDNKFYGFIQQGQNIYVSNDAGQSKSSEANGPTKGNWITPLTMNAKGELYAGYSSLYKYSGSWQKVGRLAGNADYLEIDDLNVNNMYVAVKTGLYKSTDKGKSFKSLKSFASPVSSIEVHNEDSNTIYVTTKGIKKRLQKAESYGKVFVSKDGGSTFTDITGDLPNVTKNIIRHEPKDGDNSLYLGTSLGMFTYNDNTKKWVPFTKGLPNTAVSDIEINTNSNKIVISTYGRGVWMSDLDSGLSVTNFDLGNAFKVYPNPSRGVFNIKSSINNSVNFEVYDVTGKLILSKTNVTFGNDEYALDLSGVSKGVYFLEINESNNSATKKLIVD